MACFLVTGASGSIASTLIPRLHEAGHRVVGISRTKPATDSPANLVLGDFTREQDLAQLDAYAFDAVIHLAAVTGGCSERDGILINAEGTRTLMQYAISRGCRKYVLASSIALVGVESVDFKPKQLPMPDDHPCLDQHGYGLSKHLMEEVTHYLARQHPQVSIMNLRIAAIVPDPTPDQPRAKFDATEASPWAFCQFSIMAQSDVVRLIQQIAESPLPIGVQTMNAVSSRAWCKRPVAEMLRQWWGPDEQSGVDLSYYDQPDHAFDPVYDITKLRKTYRFEPHYFTNGSGR